MPMYLRYHTKSASNNHQKINDLDFSHMKSYCAAKHTIKKVKRPLTEWENVFVNNISDKGIQNN